MSRKNNSYSNEFKLQVVQSYLNSEDSYVTTAEKFSIRSKTQVERWVQEERDYYKAQVEYLKKQYPNL